MKSEKALSFGAATASYEAGRPDYPAEAVTWMLEPLGGGAHRIADVGAGTGKLTRAVAAVTEGDVVAVDPDPGMLSALSEKSPGIPVHLGTAESLPLDDASLDAVVMGQVWHWVDPDAASREIGRVVRSGGVLGLVWNVRDERVDWVHRLTRIMQMSDAERLIAEGGPRVAAPFGALEVRSWEWSRPMTRDRLLAMADSRSYTITAPDDEKRRIHLEVGSLLDELGVRGDATIELPYVTSAFRAIREA